MIILFMLPFIHRSFSSNEFLEITLHIVGLGIISRILIFHIVMLDNMFFGLFTLFQFGLCGIWFDQMTVGRNGTRISLFEKHLYSNSCSETGVPNESIVS